MADGFLGEIRLFSFNFAPEGWARCNGQLLPIPEYAALFQLIGTTYGGDGENTFALPDLQGRLPMHVGDGIVLAQSGGELTHTLTAAEMPGHTHQASMQASPSQIGVGPSPSVVLGQTSGGPLYSSNGSQTTMSESAISVTGATQPHENRMPFLVLNFCIALTGQYPPIVS